MATAHTLTLEVATPLGLALSVEADSVQAPSVKGEFGVLPGHLPILVAVRAGLLKYKEGNQEKVAAIGPGFAQAGPDKMLILTDSLALPEDIDRAAAREELETAQKTLKESKESMESLRFEELSREIEWASAKLMAASKD